MQSPNAFELLALSSAQCPRETYLEAQTKIVLAERREFSRRIADTKMEIKKARIDACLRQIDAKQSLASLQAAVWNRATLAQRRIACMCANIDKDRANDSLTKFDAFERTKMWTALDDLIDGLVNIQKCMTGGKVPQSNAVQ
jgi:hypothetical protein